MEKKLYRVKVLLYILAENESEACVAATNAPFDIFECTARKADHLDPGWEDAVPYNSDDDRTCAEILAGQQQVRRPFAPVPVRSIHAPVRMRAAADSAAAQASPN